jgi:NADH-quinone oxidoreductase subunit N
VGTEGVEHAGWFTLLQGFAILTMSVANLVALVQGDVKRILAYSSIAHAGYLLIGLLCESGGGAAILFYLAAYTFMTVGAFAIVAYFERRDGGTTLDDYRGAGRRNAVAAVCLSVFLFSLAGIPPTAGFFGKFYLFKTAIDHGLVVLVIVAVVNSMVSAYYYLRIMVYMYMADEPAKAEKARPSVAIAVAVGLCLLFVLAMGVFPSPYLDLATSSIGSLF